MSDDPRSIFTKAKMTDILRAENKQLIEEVTNLRALHQADRRRIAELETELAKCKR